MLRVANGGAIRIRAVIALPRSVPIRTQIILRAYTFACSGGKIEMLEWEAIKELGG